MALPFKELSDRALDALVEHERGRVVAPITEWRTLAAQLREEGLLCVPEGYDPAHRGNLGFEPGFERENWRSAGEGPSFHVLRRRMRVVRWGIQLAAGVALFGTGIVFGPLIRPTAITQRGGDTLSMTTAPETFHSPEEARRALAQAQSQVQHAAAYLAASDTSTQVAGDPSIYRERLAALDEVMSATQRALRDVPRDPLLNQYYLSTIGAREATVQRLNQTLPVGTRISHF